MLNWISAAGAVRKFGSPPPDSSPGYSDSLRETNTDGGEKYKPRLLPIWKPKEKGRPTQPADGASNHADGRISHAAGLVPDDFVGSGYNALETKLGQLAPRADDWARPIELDATILRYERPLLADRQTLWKRGCSNSSRKSHMISRHGLCFSWVRPMCRSQPIC